MTNAKADSAPPTVLALAGRRTDPPDAASPRFPLHRSQEVQARLANLFIGRSIGLLVSSAACGADLLGLAAAETLGVRRLVILPFDRVRFRETSVVDRPGPWGPLYDRIVARAAVEGDLVELKLSATSEAYAEATREIVARAAAAARAGGLDRFLAVRVWDGVSRGGGDLTELFGLQAQAAGAELHDVPTTV